MFRLLFRNWLKLGHSGGSQNRALLHTKRRQLRWFGHLARMISGSESFCPTGRRLGSRLKMSWRDYISWLAWCASKRIEATVVVIWCYINEVELN